MNNNQLYNHIMQNVAKEVKKAINEAYNTEKIHNEVYVESIKFLIKDIIDCMNLKIIGLSRQNAKDRFEIAKNQEAMVISAIEDELIEYKVYSIKQWCQKNGIRYTPYMDSVYGDIVIEDLDGNDILHIDLKVGATTDTTPTGTTPYSSAYMGSPSMLSLLNFGSKQIGSEQYLYLCTNESGYKDPVFVDPNDLKQYYMTNDNAVVIASNETSPKCSWPTPIYNTLGNAACESDFIPTSVIERFGK